MHSSVDFIWDIILSKFNWFNIFKVSWPIVLLVKLLLLKYSKVYLILYSINFSFTFSVLKNGISIGCSKPITINGQKINNKHAYTFYFDEKNNIGLLGDPHMDDIKRNDDDIKIPFSELMKKENGFSLDFIIPEK